jgi:WD40 repeat protein
VPQKAGAGPCPPTQVRQAASTLTLAGHKKEVWSAKFDRKEQRIVTGSLDAQAIVWSIDGRQINKFPVSRGFVERVAFGPGDDEVMILYDYKTLETRSIRTGMVVLPTMPLDETHLDEAWAERTSTRLLSKVHQPGTIQIVLTDSRTSEAIATIGTDGGIEGARLDFPATFDRSGMLAAAGGGSDIKIFDADTGFQLAVFSGHVGGINSVRFSSSGLLLVSSSADKTARVWRVPSTLLLRGEALRTFVCRENLIDESVQAFSDKEAQDDPMLLGNSSLKNPCRNLGPMTYAFWVRGKR